MQRSRSCRPCCPIRSTIVPKWAYQTPVTPRVLDEVMRTALAQRRGGYERDTKDRRISASARRYTGGLSPVRKRNWKNGAEVKPVRMRQCQVLETGYLLSHYSVSLPRKTLSEARRIPGLECGCVKSDPSYEHESTVVYVTTIARKDRSGTGIEQRGLYRSVRAHLMCNV